MKKAILAFAVMALCAAAMANPTCTASKDQWKSEADFKKELKQQGYMVKNFNVINGCYEIYGLDKFGMRVALFFDPVTGTQLPVQ